MGFCVNCGGELKDNQDVCLHCGVSVKKQNALDIKDDGGFLWGLLGFLVPVAGLIIYLLWKDEKPLTAKAAGIGALAYLGMGLVAFVFYIVFIFILIGSTT